jgi:hypothetical protein
MEIYKFIQTEKINNYESLKLKLEDKPYNLKFKDDVNFPNLFLIHNQESSDFLLPIVNECNGIILEKDTFKIICYTFNKSSDKLEFNPKLNLNELYVEYALEGTLVRLYYYNNTWNISTKKCIDAGKSKWISEKNFSQLFQECIQNINFIENLNTECCYSFILTHPENNIVVNYTVPRIFHISTRNLTTLEELNDSIGVEKILKNKIESKDIPELLNKLFNETSLFYEGYILSDNNFNRQKIKSNLYTMVRNIWGNTNNRFLRYIEIRKDINLFNAYLYYFPSHKYSFESYENKISILAQNILEIYIQRHVKKTIVSVPFYFAKIIYKLHGDFFKTKTLTDYNKVMLFLLELNPKQLYFIINNFEKESINKNEPSIYQTDDIIQNNNSEHIDSPGSTYEQVLLASDEMEI